MPLPPQDPCTSCAAACARRGRCRRTLCTRCVADRKRHWPPRSQNDAAAATVLAGGAPPPVLAEAAAAALLAGAAQPPVLADAFPPLSLHWLHCRPCSQMSRRALLALGAQPPVLVAAAFLALAGRQTMRARHATSSEPNVVPSKQNAECRSHKGDEKKSVEIARISVTPLISARALYILPQVLRYL